MRRWIFIAVLLIASSAPARAALLLDEPYPLEAQASFPAALLHWMDSLAGLQGRGFTAGKTIEAHRVEYVKTLGPPTDADREMLARFVRVRRGFAQAGEPSRAQDLTEAIFESGSLAQAMSNAQGLLEPQQIAELRSAMEHFAPRYGKIWNDGAMASAFLTRARSDPSTAQLSRFLADVARFYGVSVDRRPRPRLLLMPVSGGFGTHAQAIGRNLLIEIREGESLRQQVPPIVHENAHFLFSRIEQERREALRATAVAIEPGGTRAWYLLGEALPTAIAQGVAGERFLGDRWTRRGPWYHVATIDSYAKQLYKLVKAALAGERRFDKRFLRRAVNVHQERP